MPTVGKKKFKYTPKGEKAAKSYAKKTNQPITYAQDQMDMRAQIGKVHPGFAAVQAKIASKEGVNKKEAGAILAASTRKASAKAKKENPKLKRVKGK